MDEKKEKIIKKLAVSVPLSTISVLFLLYDVEIIPAVKYMIIFPLVLFSGLLVGWRFKKTDNIERSDIR